MVGFLRCCLVGLLSLSVLTAHAARTVIVQPGELLPTFGPGVGPDAFIDSRDWNATVSDQKGNRHSVPVTRSNGYSWPTFRNALKNAIKVNPGQLALSATVGGALAGVGWVMSPENTSLQLKDGPDTVFGMPYKSRIGSGITWSCSYAISQGPGFYDFGPGNRQYVVASEGYVLNGFSYNSNCSSTTKVSIRNHQPVTINNGPLRNVVDSDIDAFVASLSSPLFAASAAPEILQSVPGSFDYPDSETFSGPNSIELPTTTSTTTAQDGTTTVTETIPSLDLQYSTNPLSVTITETNITNTYQNGVQTSTTTTTTTAPQTSTQLPPPEIPTDCEFMPTVCSFIDWARSPFENPDPDLTSLISDEDYSRTINFASNASCPPPAQINTSFGSYEFSWQPACTWAGMIKPFILMFALITAIYINLGAIRSSD